MRKATHILVNLWKISSIDVPHAAIFLQLFIDLEMLTLKIFFLALYSSFSIFIKMTLKLEGFNILTSVI